MLVALSVVLASPAAAGVTRRTVESALLTAGQISSLTGAEWHRFPSSDSDSEVTGCGLTESVGVTHSVERNFRYDAGPTLITEQIERYRTRELARADFRRAQRVLDGCTSLSLDGRPWQVEPLTVPDLRDGAMGYRLTGTVSSTTGEVPVTLTAVVLRHGRHTVAVLVGASGELTSGDRWSLKAAATTLARVGTAKVARVLGR